MIEIDARDLAALAVILADMTDDCYDSPSMEYWGDMPCPRCKLREFIAARSGEAAA